MAYSDGTATGSGHIGWSMFSEARERGRRKRAVLAGVRARSRGRERDDIESDLRRSFARAGIPQTPENLALQADLIADAVGPLGLLEKAVDAIRTGPKPLGLRIERERLTGDRWVPVIVADDPAARSTLRSWSTAHDAIKRNVTVDPDRGARLGASARLTLVPSAEAALRPDVGVFLGSGFVGTVPAVEADVAGLWSAIQTAESADKRLTVRARIEGDAIAVALP
jgi:hypothetical protein